MTLKLFTDIGRFREIGREIAVLSKSSKQLRKEIAAGTDRCEMGRIKVNEKEPVEFLIGNCHVSVKKSGDDFTILTKDLKQLPTESL